MNFDVYSTRRKLLCGEIEWHGRFDPIENNEYMVTITAITNLDGSDFGEWQEVETFTTSKIDEHYQAKHTEACKRIMARFEQAKLMTADEPMIIEKREI